MIKIQQNLLLEVIQYLMHHGSDAFTLKCKKTGFTTYEMAQQNL